MRRWGVGLAVLLCATAAAADGGRLRLRQDAGPFRIAVFTAPEPLTAGPADVSVLVQDRTSGEVLLDADVEVLVAAPGGGRKNLVPAPTGANRLLKAAVVSLAAPGNWRLEVVVRRAGQSARISATVPVGPPAPPWARVWPLLAAPPLAVALFVLAGALRRGPK